MTQLFLNGIELKELLSLIREVFQKELSKFQLKPQEKLINNIGGIELAQQITGLARSTIYNLVSQKKIPFCKPKNSSRLYFVESDLREWIQEGRRKTTAEITEEIDTFLSHSRRGSIQRK